MTPSSKLTFAPLYEQVKKAILNRIIAGEWGPGSFLPSEIALAKEYGVSQGTLRKALNALTREKRLVRYQGKGTAVAVLDEDSSLFPFFLLSDRNGKPAFTNLRRTARHALGRRTGGSRACSGRQSHPHRPCTYAQRFPGHQRTGRATDRPFSPFQLRVR